MVTSSGFWEPSQRFKGLCSVFRESPKRLSGGLRRVLERSPGGGLGTCRSQQDPGGGGVGASLEIENVSTRGARRRFAEYVEDGLLGG